MRSSSERFFDYEPVSYSQDYSRRSYKAGALHPDNILQPPLSHFTGKIPANPLKNGFKNLFPQNLSLHLRFVFQSFLHPVPGGSYLRRGVLTPRICASESCTDAAFKTCYAAIRGPKGSRPDWNQIVPSFAIISYRKSHDPNLFEGYSKSLLPPKGVPGVPDAFCSPPPNYAHCKSCNQM
ncbi:hypothetical protein O181_009930 [Austropuccinia psidii MF-1]|uniref:Uncharacterized protein n=1 Tax=Austropuccinia psidii MF-1 TaxID=1389203 RepID=A0A9Q3GKD9_9BASI|nr:hypothetical protein [Austropuccinia psidii MF-1]